MAVEQKAWPEVYPIAPLRMTEEEFWAWSDEDVKAEFVDGEVIVYSPASVHHVSLTWFLGALLKLFVEKHNLGYVFGTEFAVRLREGLIRVPDLILVSQERAHIIQETCIEGAPDLIIEIISPDSEERDWREKYHEYELAGVREYWVIDPYSQVVVIYRLTEKGDYQRVALQERVYRSEVVTGFWLRPAWLWQEPPPAVLEVAGEIGVI